MTEETLLIFKDDCCGCHACEIACKQEHGLGVGPRLIKVIEKAPNFIPIYCHHCADPPCGKACPVNAISRENGIVLIDEGECIGCKECIDACPFAAMQFDEERGIALKCDLCIERLKAGKAPACFSNCPTNCIFFGKIADAVSEKTRRILRER